MLLNLVFMSVTVHPRKTFTEDKAQQFPEVVFPSPNLSLIINIGKVFIKSCFKIHKHWNMDTSNVFISMQIFWIEVFCSGAIFVSYYLFVFLTDINSDSCHLWVYARKWRSTETWHIVLKEISLKCKCLSPHMHSNLCFSFDFSLIL